MKAILFLFVLLSLILPTRGLATARTLDVSLGEAFVPSSFDENERAVFAVVGLFPSNCYRLGPHALKVEAESKTITVQQRAYVLDEKCAQSIIPFANIIEVGALTPGDYQILDFNSKALLGKVTVGRAPTNPTPYAEVTDANVIFDKATQKNQLVITGHFTQRCTEIAEVKINYEERVLNVEPILKEQSRCEFEPGLRYVQNIDIRRGIQGLYFLHVQTINGLSINKIIDLK